MPTQDLATRLQIGTERWTANELNKLIPMLNAVMKELVKVLVDVDPTAVKRTAYQIERYEKLVKEINKLTRKVYAQMYNQIDAAHIDFAATHAQLAKQTINILASAEVAKLRLPESLLRSLVSDYNVIYGVPSAQYWTAHAEILADNFTRAVRHGMTLGESIGKIVDRVKSNTAYPGLRVPILEGSRKKLEILVRTSTQSLANTTHNEVYKQNADILEGVEWVSTLDNRTTPICVGLDGLVWSLPDYKPVGHKKQYPGPTAHWGCRSTQTARIKNQRRPKRTTYQEWFANKSKAFQKDVLGPARYELYKQGKLDLRDMTDFKNRPFSVKELGGVLSD